MFELTFSLNVWNVWNVNVWNRLASEIDNFDTVYLHSIELTIWQIYRSF